MIVTLDVFSNLSSTSSGSMDHFMMYGTCLNRFCCIQLVPCGGDSWIVIFEGVSNSNSKVMGGLYGPIV